ncbi:MAG: 50S ribosomal protein L11 methyltransferase [Alphaproteobacteria bacterium]
MTALAPVIWLMEIVAPARAAEPMAEILERFTDAVSNFEVDGGAACRLSAYAQAEPDRAAIEAALAEVAARLGVSAPPLGIDRLPPTDWLAENRGDFPPITAGRYLVLGSHHRMAPPAGAIVLRLDAGPAFGSGSHESTRGCLLALDTLARARRFRRPLDLGCGSGILALAMARTWKRPVLAADIDPVAVDNARANARRNGLAGSVRAVVSDGLAVDAVRRAAPFDLVAANILARPLARLAPAIGAALAPGGRAVLAGILGNQEAQVLAAYRPQGMALRQRIPMGDWVTLVLGR